MPRLPIALALAASVAMPARSMPSDPWNGNWTLDPARSSAAARDSAADAYHSTLTSDDALTLKIASFGELVTGHVDRRPMPIHRAVPTPGLALVVSRGGPRTPLCTVARDEHVDGGGSMTLVDGNTAWVDLTWGCDPSDGAELVYVKAGGGAK